MSEHGNGVSSKCEDVREVLFDYVSREMGPARLLVVREHLRNCESCRAAEEELQKTTDFLKKASQSMEGVPVRLSEDRRAWMDRAVMHPVLYWIWRHNVLVATVAVALFLLAMVLVLKHAAVRDDVVDESIPITIGGAAPGPAVKTNLNPEAKDAPDPARRE
jgi:anti-sigma factor RsiW